MTPAGLSAVIKSEIETFFGVPHDDTRLQEFCDSMGAAIVSYIQANAVVNSTGTVTSGSGSGGTVTAVGTVE